MKGFLTPILICSAFGLFAQQAPQYSLYHLNPYAYNPAYAGMENTLVATGVYRKQWADLKGAPEGQHINAHLPLDMIRSGIGLKVDNDGIGAHRTTQVLLSYSYRLSLGKEATLSAGVGGGYMQYSLDGDKLRAPQGTYLEPVFSHNDPLLPEGNVQAGSAVVEAGLFLDWRALQVGMSVQPVFSPVLRPDDQGGFALQPVQHYLLYASYSIALGEEFMLQPSVLTKSDITQTQAEISSTVRWNENIFAGASFRGFTPNSQDAVVLFGGLRVNEKLHLAYAYDLTLSPLRNVNRGSHELLLRYSLNKPIGSGKLPPIIYNPRFI
jgi:type IX secretion system PorP/SprF family membrane protein